MKAVAKALMVLGILVAVMGCAGVNTYQPTPDYGGGYNFSAGDRPSNYPPYHHSSH